MSWPWNRGQRSLKVIETDTHQSGTYDFLLTFHSNHGHISHRFRDRRRFQSKNAKIFHPRVLCAPADGVPLGIGYRRKGQKTRVMGYRAEQEVSRYLQPCGYNPPTWQTDRRTDTGRLQRPRLRIASRGKNWRHVRSFWHNMTEWWQWRRSQIKSGG